MDETKIIILAGGKGKRMGGDLPKVLVEARGRALIEHLLDSVSKLNLRPLVVVGHKGELVKERLGVAADYAVQTEQLGTGHAVLCAKDAAGEAGNIIVLYGDMPCVSAGTIQSLLAAHENEDAVITMPVIRVPHFENEYSGFRGFGRIMRGENGAVIKIIESKDLAEDQKSITELTPGLFCFRSDWLWNNLPLLNNNNAQKEFYLSHLPELAMAQGQKIIAPQISTFECVGVNTPEELKFAEEKLG